MFLGIDIGTSAVKTVMTDQDGNVVASASAELSASLPQVGWSEQDPKDWVAATIATCSTLAHQHAKAWRNIRAIGLSGQMHGAVLLDKSLAVLRPAILWNDGRSKPQCDALNAGFANLEIKAGIMAMPGFTAPKVMWCAENEPEIYDQIAHILLPKDYVRLFLTGTLAMDCADAAGTLWFDQATRSWSRDLCEATQTDLGWLPTLFEGPEISGHLTSSAAQQLDLSASIAVVAGAGDAAAGAIGIGAVKDGEAFVSLGTSGQLFVATNSYRPAPGTAVHSFAHGLPDRWFQMAVMLNGASPMQWLAKTVNQPIETLLQDAEKEREDILFLPYLTGERTPHNDPDIRGAFTGLSVNTNAGHMMRAVTEAIAFSFRDCLDCMKKAGTEVSELSAIGGGARSDFLLQMMADNLNCAIARRQSAEAGPALGAARLAILSKGDHNPDQILAAPPVEKIFQPRHQESEALSETFARWKNLYMAVKSLD